MFLAAELRSDFKPDQFSCRSLLNDSEHVKCYTEERESKLESEVVLQTEFHR